MTRSRDEFEERNVERALAGLRDGIEPPSEDELRALARTASATTRTVQPPARRRSALPLRARWTVAAAAAALLVGSGLGFGVGSSVTPTVQARTAFTGTGFLPAQGWNVMQSGTASSSKRATAVAANVPLHPKDAPGTMPASTLASLPAHGVLIHATFTKRGDPMADAVFRERALPLQVTWAKAAAPGQYRLRAGTGGFNVDAWIHYGTVPPSKEMLGEAQLQLSRLVVAPERVTLNARPTKLRWAQGSTLFGGVSSGKADEEVTLQAKDCGQRTFTGVAAILTHEGGTWTTQFARGINSTIRAVWKGEASATIALRQQPRVELQRRPGGRWAIGIGSRWQFWHKKALLQRRVGSKWTTVKTVLLTKVSAPPGTGSTWTEGEFKFRAPRGSVLRAMLPAGQAKPCYLAASSDTVRT
jgi:hypothetical protein